MILHKLTLNNVGLFRGKQTVHLTPKYKAYKKTQQALKYSEDMTFLDEEIDAFLSGELKRSYQNDSLNE